MMRFTLTAAALFCASAAMAGDVTVHGAYVPVAPPGVMSHAAYLSLANAGDQSRSLIGVEAKGYGMAHLHKSEEVGGVATMSMLHQLDIAPGQTVELKPGGLHIMLMGPESASAVGDTVALTLIFASGQRLAVEAKIEARGNGS
ncbi:MAG: copper chaperone PCu(A)C [Pseudomonadota bacterium]